MDFDATDALFWFAMGWLASWAMGALAFLILHARAPRYDIHGAPAEGD